VFEPNPVTRFHHDIQAALHHHALSWDAHAESFARTPIRIALREDPAATPSPSLALTLLRPPR